MFIGYLVAGEHNKENRLFADKTNFLVILVDEHRPLILKTLRGKDGSIKSLADKLNNLELPVQIKDNGLPPNLTMKYGKVRSLEPREKREFYKYCTLPKYGEDDDSDSDEDEVTIG